MERRKFVTGMGALASGSAAAVGTSAFGDVNADRNLEGRIVQDNSAYLGLSSLSQYSQYDSGEIEITLNSLNDNAENSFDEVIELTNSGIETAYVWVELTANGDSSNVYFYENGNETTKISTNSFTATNSDVPNDEPSVIGAKQLGVGNSFKLGLFFDTGPSSGGAFAADPAFAVHADSDSSNSPIGLL